MCDCTFALLLFSLCKNLNFGENHEVNGVILLLPGLFDREMSVFLNYLYKPSAPQCSGMCAAQTHLGRFPERIFQAYSLRYFWKMVVRAIMGSPVLSWEHCTMHFL